MDTHLHIGALIFPQMDQIDFTGPFEVLSRVPDSTFHVIWKEAAPIRDIHGLILTPEETFSDAPPLDLLVVPGGWGQELLMEDEAVLAEDLVLDAHDRPSSPHRSSTGRTGKLAPCAPRLDVLREHRSNAAVSRGTRPAAKFNHSSTSPPPSRSPASARLPLGAGPPLDRLQPGEQPVASDAVATSCRRPPRSSSPRGRRRDGEDPLRPTPAARRHPRSANPEQAPFSTTPTAPPGRQVSRISMRLRRAPTPSR